jgi:hypothetical protein
MSLRHSWSVDKKFGKSPQIEVPLGSPADLREGVRLGVLQALAEDRDWRGAWAARRLAVAGVLGVAMAVAMTLLFAWNSLHKAHAWHLAACGAAWSGLLVECFAFVLLRLRTRRLPFVQAAALGLVGLGLAAIVCLCCPAPQFLEWWRGTSLGGWVETRGGLSASAFGFGFSSAAFLGLAATLVLTWLGGKLWGAAVPSATLSALLLPAVLLQSLEFSFAVLSLWGVGTVLGSLAGVTTGMVLGSLTSRPTP